MRPARFCAFLVLSVCVYLPVHAKPKRLTVTGKLMQLPATSSDSAGWALQLNPVITVDGRQLSNLEIETPHPQKLESLQDEFVQASGSLSITIAESSGERPILKLSSIRTVKYNNPDSEKPKASFWSSLINFFSLSPI
jgi:hypothetical protein